MGSLIYACKQGTRPMSQWLHWNENGLNIFNLNSIRKRDECKLDSTPFDSVENEQFKGCELNTIILGLKGAKLTMDNIYR